MRTSYSRYVQIAASVVPDIVRDGKRLIEETKRVVVDIPYLELPSSEVMHKDLAPVMKRLSRPVAEELRSVLGGFPSLNLGVPVEGLSGGEVSTLLMGEGFTEPDPISTPISAM